MENYFFLPALFCSINIWSVLHTQVGRGWSYPAHKHPLFEVMYCEGGQLTERVNGVEYELGEGDFILIPSGAHHDIKALEPSKFFNFHFDIEPREVHALFHIVKEPILSCNQSHEVQTEIRVWMNKLIEQFVHIKQNRRSTDMNHSGWNFSLSNMSIQSIMIQFLVFILEKTVYPHLELSKQARTSASQHQIAHEAAYLLETFPFKYRGISDLAKALNIHRNYLTSSFKRIYGVTPKHYLVKVRIERAKRILQETTLPIEEISSQLSFSSTANFCRFFREHVGMTPHQFRTPLG